MEGFKSRAFKYHSLFCVDCFGDFGIVFSDSPYLIGVYTLNVPDADELIANISRKVLDLKKEE